MKRTPDRDLIALKPEPCELCGLPDSRHRLVDSEMERVIAGEDIADVAYDYGTNVEKMVEQWQDAYTTALEAWGNLETN